MHTRMRPQKAGPRRQAPAQDARGTALRAFGFSFSVFSERGGDLGKFPAPSSVEQKTGFRRTEGEDAGDALRESRIISSSRELG